MMLVYHILRKVPGIIKLPAAALIHLMSIAE